jgi:hypothetical protein
MFQSIARNISIYPQKATSMIQHSADEEFNEKEDGHKFGDECLF